MLDGIRTLDRHQYARKMHLKPDEVKELFIFNELKTFRTRVQLPPAPPKFSIGDYQSHPMKS